MTLKVWMHILSTTREIWLVLLESVKSFGRNLGFQRSATLAYYSFLAMLPLCLLVFIVAGRWMLSSDALLTGLSGALERVSPQAATIVLGELKNVAVQRSWGIFGILILFWSITPMAAALRLTFGDIFKKRHHRPFLLAKLFDVLSVLLLALLLILLTVGKAYGHIFSAIASHWPFMSHVVSRAVPFLLALGAFALFYVLLTPVRLQMRHLLAGTLITLFLLALVGPAFALLMRINPHYGYAFGSLKTVFLLFIWVYYSFVAILFGAEFMANFWRKDVLILRRLLQNPEKTELFRSLPHRFLRTYQQQEIIFQEGDCGDEMFFIMAGTVQLIKKGTSLLAMKPGDYFGEMAMLLGAPRTATAMAKDPVAVLAVISRANFKQVLGENPEIVFKMLQEIALRLKNTTSQLSDGVETKQCCGDPGP